jgi:hypothetical protein
MKLYIKAYSSNRANLNASEVKKELKAKYKLDTRRQDAFIHLAVYGAKKLQDEIDISVDDELYVTSGVGNIDVLQKTNMYVKEENEFIKPFDFINMLGNTTSYYIASSLGLKNKNTFQISDNFTFLNTLISVYASLNVSKSEAILGAIDLITEPNEIIKRVLDIDEEVKVVSSVNYQKLSLDATKALASVEFDANFYTYEEIKNILEDETFKIIVSIKCTALEYEKNEYYNETYASSVLNDAIRTQKNTLFVEFYNDRYKIMRITVLK